MMGFNLHRAVEDAACFIILLSDIKSDDISLIELNAESPQPICGIVE